MTVRIQCPKCAKSYDADESCLGRSVICKACGTKFAAGSASESFGDQAARSTNRPAMPTTKASAGLAAKIARFDIRGRLGAGGFGQVYRAYDPVLGRKVALKVPHAGSLQTANRKERFLREAKAAAQLRHPNIVPVYEAGADGEPPRRSPPLLRRNCSGGG